ncbi:probable LRR receptor-like serine/threonine-protein kinase At1g05700 [Aristolochia californica]|uniref:probable LRR receptor-like serine/threonine-protein kinase At1g05700 n=1 Tax=Aristolochia californica TaxID=171875 RepID=UPI0035DB5D2D
MTVIVRVSFLFLLAAFVEAQNGFISIDCGIPEGTNYTDEQTGIFYTSDADYIQTGENRRIPTSLFPSVLGPQYLNLKRFPEGSRNCYTLKPVLKGNRYLIRASFLHGNYEVERPSFDLYLGVNLWVSIAVVNASAPAWSEIITIATSNFVSVCLLKKKGAPFISVLELRPLGLAMYNVTDETHALVLYNRYDIGSTTGRRVRYKDDIYDRIWSILEVERDIAGIKTISTTSPTVNNDVDMFQIPPAVLSTAATAINRSTASMLLNWTSDDPQTQFHIFRHFAEVEQLKDGEVREFNVCISGFSCQGPFRPTYLSAFTVFTTTPVSGRSLYTSFFEMTDASSLPPILNGVELYSLAKLSVAPTASQDLEAIMAIRDAYNVKKNWMGDSCVPQLHKWEGLDCSQNDPDPPSIVSLNLTSTGLTGTITSSFRNLTSLRSLDLSRNNLTGEIPDFLATLPYLAFLNLSRNNFTGSVPSTLLQMSKAGTLQLSIDYNPNLNPPDPCSDHSCKKKKSIAVPVALSASLVALILLVSIFVFWRKFERRKPRASQAPSVMSSETPLVLDNQRFSYADIINITNNFEMVLGKGGFGVVYYGKMDDGTQVAVKMLSTNCQGSGEFQTEAQLLMKVYHRNLVQMIGCCSEGDKMALVLEYMSEGHLGKLLKDSSKGVLTWVQRIRIGLDIAQGLEYLHIGCRPPIIHRDVKAANILLSEIFEAKIADFGLSKVFHNEEFTHVSTAVKGTLGYLDPEYFFSNTLNEKSDVYSYGVVLLELITGKSAIVHTSNSQRISLVEWVSPFILNGNIRNAVDPRLRGNYDSNSVWKAIEIAHACTLPKSVERPTMSVVVSKLKDCLGAPTIT